MHSTILSTTTTLTSLLSIASFAFGAPTTVTPTRLSARASDLENCLSDAKIPFSSKSTDSGDFNDGIKPFNQRLPFQPVALVTPTTVDQISQSVTCASSGSNPIPIQARGGGHAYNAAGIGGKDGAMIIDLKNFDQIKIEDGGDGIVSVGGGARLGDVGNTLWNDGTDSRSLANGVCPFVGVGGHAAHGGFGYASRMWGLLSDQVSSLDVVLPNGNATTITPASDPDLFFAFTGAGSSFGIVTTYHFQTHQAPENAVQFHYTWDSLNVQDESDIFLAFQDFVGSDDDPIPAELGISVGIGSGNVDIYGAFYGTQDDFDPLIQKLLDSIKVGSPQVTKKNLNWLESLQDFAGKQALVTKGQTESKDDFYATSLLTPMDTLLTKEAVTSFVQYLQDQGANSDTAWFVEVNTYGGSKSAIANKDLLSKSSFAYRQHLLNFQMYASSKSYGPPYPSDGISFIQDMRSSITDQMKDTQFGFYTNYQDSQLGENDFGTAYWADQYEKLQGIKKTVDSNNVFNGPQTVRTA